MGTLNDLQTLVRLLEEFELPVSPILQYAIKEKMASLHGGQDTIEYDSTVELKCEAFHKNPPTTLRVEFPDGTVISELKAVDALKQTINKIGPELIEILCFSEPILRPCNIDLVTRRKISDERYQSCMHHLNNSYFLFTKTSTEVKKRQLEFISKALSLNLKIDIVKRNTLLR